MVRVLLIAAALIPCSAAWAQPTAAEPPHAGEQVEHEHRNHAAVYLGFTANDGTHFTLGAEYVRRNPEWKRFGVGGFAEFVFADDTEFLVGATGAYFAANHLVLEAGPGLAFHHGTEFLFRAGAGYEVELQRLTLTPKAYVDFVNSETAFGFGIAIGRAF